MRSPLFPPSLCQEACLEDLVSIPTRGQGNCLIYAIFHNEIYNQVMALAKRLEFANLVESGMGWSNYHRLWDFGVNPMDCTNTSPEALTWVQVLCFFPFSA